MTIGLNAGFDIARKGLRASLAGLNVSGQNVVNVNTEGYSRRRVDFAEPSPLVTPHGIFGMGVDVENVSRIRNALLDRQYRTVSSPLKQTERLESVYRQIEAIYNEPVERGGIRQLMSDFFNAFADLSNEPESLASRALVRDMAETLSEALYRVDQQITILGNDLRFELEQKMGELNTTAEKIAQLNLKIHTQESAAGTTANELRDERDRNLDKLAELSDIYYAEEPSGAINVSLGGKAIVTGGAALINFEVETSMEDRDLQVRVLDQDTGTELNPITGDLRGLLDSVNEVLPEYRSKLDVLTNALITSVNNTHRNGVGLKGSLLEVPQDNDFFVGSNAGDIGLANAILESPNNIGTGKRVLTTDPLSGEVTVTGNPGDNTIALELANMKRSLVLEDNTATLDEYLARVIGELGSDSSKFSDATVSNTRLQKEFQNLRDATSGVSIDEEVTSLIQFQRSFQASARVITTLDEMFQTLVSM
jgi:flagellar hook-associated protein 1